MVAKHRGETNSGHSISSNRIHPRSTIGVSAIFKTNTKRGITKVPTSDAIQKISPVEGEPPLYDSASRRADIEIEKWIRERSK